MLNLLFCQSRSAGSQKRHRLAVASAILAFLMLAGPISAALSIDGSSRQLRKQAAELTRDGMYADALFAQQQILAATPGDAVALRQLACLYLKLNDMGRAEEAARKACAASPANATAYYNLGIIQQSAGKPFDALAAFEKALAIDPANRHAQLGRYQCVILAGLPPGDLNPLKLLSRQHRASAPVWQTLGAAYLLKGQYQEAERAAARALVLAPNSFDTIRILALSKMRLLKRGAASVLGWQLTRIRPGSKLTYLFLARCYLQSNNPAQACAVVESAHAALPEAGSLLYEIGVQYMAKATAAATRSNIAEARHARLWLLAAEKALRYAVRANPGSLDGQTELVKALSLQGKNFEALDAVRQAKEHYPENVFFEEEEERLKHLNRNDLAGLARHLLREAGSFKRDR